MRGTIRSYDSVTGTGVITGENGDDYLFSQEAIHTGHDTAPGHAVDFVPSGTAATAIVILDLPPPSASFGSASGLHSTGPGTEFGHHTTPAAAAFGMEEPFDVQAALLSFEGRLRRRHFWYAWLMLLGAGVVAGWIPVLGLLIAFALIWPNLAITVKRLHDMGHTGWLALVPCVGTILAIAVAVIGGAGAYTLSAVRGDLETASALAVLSSFGLSALIALVTNLGFLLWIGLADSQRGPNRFGPNPKGIG